MANHEPPASGLRTVEVIVIPSYHVDNDTTFAQPSTPNHQHVSYEPNSGPGNPDVHTTITCVQPAYEPAKCMQCLYVSIERTIVKRPREGRFFP